MFKAGAHKKDQAAITNMAKDGMTSVAISKALKIEKDVVEKFMPKENKGGKK